MKVYDARIDLVETRIIAWLGGQLGKDNIKIMHEKFKEQFMQSKVCKMSHLKDLPLDVGSIIWVKQIDRQLTAIIRRVEDGLGKGCTNHVEDQKLLAVQKETRTVCLRNQQLHHTLLQQFKMNNKCQASIDTLNLKAIEIQQQFEILRRDLIQLKVHLQPLQALSLVVGKSFNFECFPGLIYPR